MRFPYKAPVVFVADSGAVDMLLHADPDRAHAGSARRSVLPQASGSSPFGGDGSVHQLTRAQMWPGFCPERIATIEPGIAELATTHAARWPMLRPFRLLEAMRSLCTEITVRLVLGVSDPDRGARLIDAIRRLLNTPGNPPLPLPGGGDDRAGAAGWVGDAMFARRAAPVRELLFQELHERRLAGRAGEDVLGAMLGSGEISDGAIIDELLIVLMAAQEPPAIALTNIICELARAPLVAARFRADPSARRAIIAEVLRLRPSASAALRRLTEPMDLAGHALPAGAVIACPSPLLHREPTAFPDPDAFVPARFAKGIPAGAPYIPFGGGARRCLGEVLAEAEFRAVLPAVLDRRRFWLVWPRAERMVVRATVLVPHRGGLVSTTPIG